MSRRITLFDFVGEDDPNLNAIISDDVDLDNYNKNDKTKRTLLKIINNELTARQKQIIVLYYFKEMNIIEISQKLNISPASVSITLKRARNRIMKYMKYYF